MIESVWNRPVKANWGGRPYSPSDAMYAVAPINRNITLLGWKASISLKEGIRILHEDMKTYEMNNPVLILGAGISGLGAAYKLSCNGQQTVVWKGYYLWRSLR